MITLRVVKPGRETADSAAGGAPEKGVVSSGGTLLLGGGHGAAFAEVRLVRVASLGQLVRNRTDV
jgi:hypothetical protein